MALRARKLSGAFEKRAPGVKKSSPLTLPSPPLYREKGRMHYMEGSLSFIVPLIVRITHYLLEFFKKIQDWILKSERIRKRVLGFFIKQINPRSLGSWRIKGAEESTLEIDSSVSFTSQDPRDLGLICLIRKLKIRFRILSDFQSWIFLKKRTLSHNFAYTFRVSMLVSTSVRFEWIVKIVSGLYGPHGT